MRLTPNTTTHDLVTEFSEGVSELLEDIVSGYERGQQLGLDERLMASKTRKQILKYFFDNGGL